MVLRLAYFVLVHSIPHELCLNGDHTGIMFTLAKGKMWTTKAMHESKDKSVNNHHIVAPPLNETSLALNHGFGRCARPWHGKSVSLHAELVCQRLHVKAI